MKSVDFQKMGQDEINLWLATRRGYKTGFFPRLWAALAHTRPYPNYVGDANAILRELQYYVYGISKCEEQFMGTTDVQIIHYSTGKLTGGSGPTFTRALVNTLCEALEGRP